MEWARKLLTQRQENLARAKVAEEAKVRARAKAEGAASELSLVTLLPHPRLKAFVVTCA